VDAEVICLDAQSGELLWNTPVFVAAVEKKHSLNSQATPTQATLHLHSRTRAFANHGPFQFSKHAGHFYHRSAVGARHVESLGGDQLDAHRGGGGVAHRAEPPIASRRPRRPEPATAPTPRSARPPFCTGGSSACWFPWEVRRRLRGGPLRTLNGAGTARGGRRDAEQFGGGADPSSSYLKKNHKNGGAASSACVR
jgi:hypothetical protein